MGERVINNVKLGAFVLSGLLMLALLLYMIGKNRNLFGSTYILKARFNNTQGLVAGNNVRFSGVDAGTVKRITILADTVIEVTMVIDTKMETIIRKNAIVSIGTDGLVGNKVVNIVPEGETGPLAVEGDLLASKKMVNTNEMLQTLYKTNNDLAIIAENLKTTIQQINNSSGLWALLNDTTIPRDVRTSLGNIRLATGRAGAIAGDLQDIVREVKNGKGSVGALLVDTSFSYNLNAAILKIAEVGAEADSLASEISKVVSGIQQDINSGKGTVNALLKDSVIVIKLNASLDNIQKGTDAFNQDMEALKHSSLLRGYFKKQEKQEQRRKEKDTVKNK